MCINYVAVTQQTLQQSFDFDVPGEWASEVWQDYPAPIIIDQGDGPAVLLATYGMISKDKLPPEAHFTTMNARAESVGEKRAYREAWLNSQLCLVPMMGFYEPCYESGHAERWQIGLADDEPFAVAGLYRSWDELGGITHTFTQLTINADNHPLMSRMHKPGSEKRSLVIIPRSDYEHWLTCRNPEIARSFLQPYPAGQMKAWSTGPYRRS